MAVRKSIQEIDDNLLTPRPPIDDEGRERLRNDPRVRYQKRNPNLPPRSVKPWVSVTEPIDVLWLLGRRTKDGERVPDSER